jgi:hypothetical protein
MSPVWVIVYGYVKPLVRMYRTEREADGCIFHNKFYGHACLKVRVKEWKPLLEWARKA